MPERVDKLLGEAYRDHESGNLDAAERKYRQALALDPNDADAAHLLSMLLGQRGGLLEQSGDLAAATALYTEALETAPRNALAALAKGMALAQQAAEAEAAIAFRQALQAEPGLAEAHFQLAHLRSEPVTAAEIAAMTRLFEEASIESADRALLAFAAGRAYGKSGDLAAEIEWLERAHEILAAIESFDMATYRRRIDSLVSTFRARLVSADSSDAPSELLFVVGMPRSGTTLVDQVLASHPDVYAPGELLTGNKAVRISRSAGAIEQLDDRKRRDLAGEVRKLMPRLPAGRRILVDTTPSNFQFVGLLAWLFPGARFVHCARHALDTCLSIRQHPLSNAHAYAHRIEQLAEYYASYRRVMAHWHEVLPGKILDVRYESLVSDFEAEVRTLLDFCSLKFDAACLDFHKTERAIATPSAGQVRQPLYASSVSRWKRYADQLQPLKAALESALGESLD